MEWKVGRKKGKGVCVRDKKNKLSVGLDWANHPMIVTLGQQFWSVPKKLQSLQSKKFMLLPSTAFFCVELAPTVHSGR